jgi:hypothetical protein
MVVAFFVIDGGIGRSRDSVGHVVIGQNPASGTVVHVTKEAARCPCCQKEEDRRAVFTAVMLSALALYGCGQFRD